MRERFLDKLQIGDGCWEWLGAPDSQGYGRIRETGKYGRTLSAHRVSYEMFVGPIPRGLVLDHLCRNHICVRPDHLEPVTNAVNVMRGDSPQAKSARMTHCKRGHLLEWDIFPSLRGRRRCRICHREATRISMQRRRVVA